MKDFLYIAIPVLLFPAAMIGLVIIMLVFGNSKWMYYSWIPITPLALWLLIMKLQLRQLNKKQSLEKVE